MAHLLSRRTFIITIGLLVLTSTASAKRRRRLGADTGDNDIPLRFRGHGLARGQVPKSKVLTKPQLKDCVIRHEALDESQAKIDENQSELNKMEQALEEKSRSIDESRVAVDRYSKESVDQFNAALGEHQLFVDRYNDGVSKLNSDVNQSNQDVLAFNAHCGERQYYIDDMRSVLRVLGITTN